MSVIYAALLRFTVARARLSTFGRVQSISISRVDVDSGAPPSATPSLDFSQADNSMYLGLF